MTWATLQAVEVLSLGVLAGFGHATIAPLRHSLISGRVKLDDRVLRGLTRATNVVEALVYVGFAVAVVPVGALRPDLTQVDAVLDAIGLFALVVAMVEVTALLVLHRVAQHFEPWPPVAAGGAA